MTETATYAGYSADELRELAEAAPPHTTAAPLIVYGTTGDTPVPRARAMLDFYTAAYAALRALLDHIAALQHEREALMTGLGLDHETPGAHTLSEMRAAGAGALMRIEHLETELDRLRGAAQTFCEERTDAALDRLIAALEEATGE